MNELEQILSGLQSIGAELKALVTANKSKAQDLDIKLAEVAKDKISLRNINEGLKVRESQITILENVQEARNALSKEREEVLNMKASLETSANKMNEEYQKTMAEAQDTLLQAKQVKDSAISFQKALEEEKENYKQKILDSITKQTLTKNNR